MHNTLSLRGLLAMLMIGTLLAGCATAAQRQLQTIAANNKATLLESQECVAAIYNSPELEPLRADLPLNPESATLAQLANENFASGVEVQVIAANYPRLQACRQNTVNRLAQTTPGWVPIFAKMFVTNDNNLVLLFSRSCGGANSSGALEMQAQSLDRSYRLKISGSWLGLRRSMKRS